MLNVVDDVTHECLAAVVDASISDRRLVRELGNLIAKRGRPKMDVNDNVLCREATSVSEWQADARHGVVATFGGRMRDEMSNETLFFTIDQARAILARWFNESNTARRHASLGYATPAALAAGLKKQRTGLTPPAA